MKEIDTDFRQDIALPWITFSLFGLYSLSA
jgi:hypothetical protein